jgi:hypothetical protein
MSNNDDFYLSVTRERLLVLDAARVRTLADLQEARVNGDTVTAGDAVQTLANLDNDRRNLVDLSNQYVASQQPAQAPELSAEERAAKPWHRMDYRDTWEIAKNSKHGIDENAFRAGIAEVQRRKARGE